MKLAASRKTVSLSEQRRNSLQLERRSASALRDLYPSVGHLQVSLIFEDGSALTPSPQSHTFYPAAQAFFRFACPCAECDGDFDLREVIGVVLADMARSQRHAARNARGRLSCQGVRLRDRVGSRPCAMTLEYQITAGPIRPQ